MKKFSRYLVAFDFASGTKYLWAPEQLIGERRFAFRFRRAHDARNAAERYLAAHHHKEYSYSIEQCDEAVSVLAAIKPYYVFLILAEKIGAVGVNRKTIEVRKDVPVSQNWNGAVFIYCTKDEDSFKRIPKEYQPFMRKYLGKVVGRFTVDETSEYHWGWHSKGKNRVADTIGHCIPFDDLAETCLTQEEIDSYGPFGESVYGWHISTLIMFDNLLPLNRLFVRKDKCDNGVCENCQTLKDDVPYEDPYYCMKGFRPITRPPQNWMYFDYVSVG